MSPPLKKRHIDTYSDDSALPLPSPSASPIHNSKDDDTLLYSLLERSSKHTLSAIFAHIGSTLRKDLIYAFPREISNLILSFLDHKDLIQCLQVSQKWNMVINNIPELWKNLLLSENWIKEDEYNDELSYFQFIRPDLPVTIIPRLIYARRLIIHRRWMDKSFKPEVKLLSGDALNVITCIQLDKKRMAAGSNANHILVYETDTGRLIQTLKGHTGGVWAMKFAGDILASGSTDRTVRIWNLRTGKCTHIFHGHTSTVRCLEIIEPKQISTDDEGNPVMFPESPLLITGSRDATLYVWKLPTLDDEQTQIYDYEPADNPFFVNILKGHSASVRAVTGYSNILISGSYDHTARVWDLRTNECKWVLSGHTDRIYSCVYDIKRNRCYTGSVDNTVRIWDLDTGETISILEGHQILVGLITSSENVLVSAAADSTVRVWDPDTGHAQHVFRGHSAAITCVANDDRKVISGSQGMLKLWDTKSGELVRDLAHDVDGAVWQVAMDYKRCLAAVQRRDVTYLELTEFAWPGNDPAEWLYKE